MGEAEDRECARASVLAWAGAGALTDMQSKDAALTRSRLVAEIALAAIELDRQRPFAGHERRALERWSESIVANTASFFARGAGPVSRANNHRYWAALAVGALGHLADRPEWRSWARESAAIGHCAVTAEGLLPLELERDERALRYHLYALRPLLAWQRLDRTADVEAHRPCAEGLERLARATEAMLADPSAIAARTGAPQMPRPSERDHSPFLRLNETLPIAAGSAATVDPTEVGAVRR